MLGLLVRPICHIQVSSYVLQYGNTTETIHQEAQFRASVDALVANRLSTAGRTRCTHTGKLLWGTGEGRRGPERRYEEDEEVECRVVCV